MSLLNRVKDFVLGQDSVLIEKDEILSAKDYDELVGIIKNIKRVNEVQVREIERDIEKLSAIENEEMLKIKSGTMIERRKKLALLAIRRIRREISIFDRKIEIHSKNIDTHQSIIGTVEEIKSKEMLGVNEDLIMKVIESAAKNDEKFQEVITTASAIEHTSVPVLTASDKAELEAIEKEILLDLDKNDAEINKTLENEIDNPLVKDELESIEKEILGEQKNADEVMQAKSAVKKEIDKIEREIAGNQKESAKIESTDSENEENQKEFE
ncbi:MAG: hypothetical protein K8S87_01355 [Planctomycetes bacterium]|nr:hypothetical protein [Planctomycetota bacterium]